MEGKVHKGDVWSGIREFKRKYYISQLIKGSIFLLATVLSVFLLVNFLEFSFRFGSQVRTALFIILVISFLSTFYYYLLDPLLKLMGRKKGMSDEEAARRIGSSFPSIRDRLLNLIQLRKFSDENSLVGASITQKSEQVSDVSYRSSIRLSENRKYIKYLLSPLSIIALLALIYPSFLTEPSERIVKFNREFVPEAPFSFNVQYDEYAFKNEDFNIQVDLEGDAFPDNLYLLSNGRKIKMTSLGDGQYEHIFRRIQDDRKLVFEGAGFFSGEYQINVVERPNLRNFNVQLSFPAYTGRNNERLSNIGNLEIPEGTSVNWQVSTLETDELSMFFHADSNRINARNEKNNLFELDKKFFESDSYSLELKNGYSKNKDLINYYVRVIKDEYPEIDLTVFQDTVLYSMIALGGNLSDDYGISRLLLKYSVSTDDNESGEVNTVRIPVNRGQANQGFYYNWSIDSLNLQAGQRINYYMEVWDNDGINGSKATRSGRYQFRLPSRAELRAEMQKSSDEAENQIENSIQESTDLQEKLKEAEERFKGKRDLDWEDEKLLKEILEQKEEIERAIEEMQEMNRNNNMQKNRFSPQTEQMKERDQQLQQLMDELMTDEMRQMFEELQKLMEEDAGVEQIQQMMDQLSRKQNLLQRELNRSLERFKRLKLDNQLNEVINEMDQLSQEQLDLSDRSLDEEEAAKELLDKQKELIDRFNKLKEEVDKAHQLNQELDNPAAIPNQNDLTKEVESEQQRSEDILKDLSGDKDQNEQSADGEQQSGEQNESASEESQSGSQNEESTQGNEQGEQAQQNEGKQGEEGNESESGENNESGSGEEEQQGESGEQGSGQEQESQQQEGGEQQGSSQEGGQQEQGQQQPSGEQQSPSNSSQQRQDASDAQQKAGQQLRKMSQEMQQMQAGMEMQQLEANIQDLRNIVNNLIKLSFSQEDLMDDFREVNESDPGFVPLSQEQLKLRDDAKVIEDSLYSLANRMGELGAGITRDVDAMNEHMEKALDALKERRKYQAVSEQQFAMTNMNNLALVLDEILQNAMNSMASGKGQQKNQQNNQSLGEMQQQLNQQIQELKESGKSGRELSEELAKLAAQQARIRKALQEMQERLNNMDMEGNEAPGGDIPAKMENTEIDLVNKRLTEQLIRRQQDILSRLLEAENAMRERELDEERKGETAKEYEKVIPREFDDYLKLKEKEIEMLKTLPPKLYPYYKKEVSDYFKRIGEVQN